MVLDDGTYNNEVRAVNCGIAAAQHKHLNTTAAGQKCICLNVSVDLGENDGKQKSHDTTGRGEELSTGTTKRLTYCM